MRKRRGNLQDASDEVVRRLYCKELLTYDEIGMRFGVTRQAVAARVKKIGIEYRGEPTEAICQGCGAKFMAQRKRVKLRKIKFCSTVCYHKSVSLFGAYSHNGQRTARKIMGAAEGEVVHHIDGDSYNNSPANLMVFPSNAAHILFHKSGAAKMLKEKTKAGDIQIRQTPLKANGLAQP